MDAYDSSGYLRAPDVFEFNLCLYHNVSCTLHFDEDHTDVKTDVTIADYLHVQLFKCPLNSLSHST